MATFPFNLSLKIPPLLLVGLFALAMKLGNSVLPLPLLNTAYNKPLALVLLIFSISLITAGIGSFRKAQTTVNPTQPNNTSQLVTTGIYRLSRNPMYVGFMMALIAWGIVLANPLVFLGVVGFYGYMNHFQIAPEEEALQNIFGEAFTQYCVKVRRWL
jgi:protein-S-isoprenylcysteine O-methyltransferase Ste14